MDERVVEPEQGDRVKSGFGWAPEDPALRATFSQREKIPHPAGLAGRLLPKGEEAPTRGEEPMHLITAALVTAVLGGQRNAGRAGLPSFVGVMETTHALPGRLRLRAPVLIGRRAAAEQLQKSLAKIEGVRAVAASPVSGSVLVSFAPDRVTPDLLMGAAIRLLGLEKAVERAPPSAIGEGIRHAGESLNHAIHERTGGLLDLWTSLTLLLAAAGIRRLAAGDPFGWPLLWWAYRNAFTPQGSGE